MPLSSQSSPLADIEDALFAHWAQFGHWPKGEHDGDVAIGKGYLSLAGPPGVAAIFGMSVVPEARGRGVASALTGAILEEARRAGCHRAVLHSTAMAAGVYRRAGFADCCTLTIFATASLWAAH